MKNGKNYFAGLLAVGCAAAMCLAGCRQRAENAGETEPTPESAYSQTGETVQTGETAQNGNTAWKALEWTEHMKNVLQSMCYTVPDFAGEEELTDKYMRDLLFYTYTGGKYTAGVTEKNGALYVDENSATELIKLVLGKEYDVTRLTDETKQYGYCYYSDGSVVIQLSDYGDIDFDFNSITEEDGCYKVIFDTFSGGEREECWPHIISIVPADNENGFTVQSVETHYTVGSEDGAE